MRYLYPGLLMVWLASGFGMHTYVARTMTVPAGVESVQGQAVHPQANRDLREAHKKVAVAYGIWALTGFVLALRGVHLLFRRADEVADIEKFLAASIALMLWAGPLPRALEAARRGQESGPVASARADVASGRSGAPTTSV